MYPLCLTIRFYRYHETLLGTIERRSKGKGSSSEAIKKVKVPLPIVSELIPNGEGNAERIFLSEDEGTSFTKNEPVTCVERLVSVAYVMPGRSPPPASIANYWFDQVE